MSAMASQITSLTIVYWTVYSIRRRSKRKHQSSTSLAFVRGIHRWPVNSPHKWPVMRKMLPFDDVIKVLCHLWQAPNNSRSVNFASWRKVFVCFVYTRIPTYFNIISWYINMTFICLIFTSHLSFCSTMYFFVPYFTDVVTIFFFLYSRAYAWGIYIFRSLCRDSVTLRKPKKTSSTGRVALKYINRI